MHPKKRSPHRRAGACPSPASAHSNDGEGQALALRAEKIPAHRRAWALGCHTRIRAGFPASVRAPDLVVQERLLLTRL